MKESKHYSNQIWADEFCGGAGASTGIAKAVGELAYWAVNHSHAALDMYKQNHPLTNLYCEDIFAFDPIAACEGRDVWLLWVSPDCTHHSKARGGKPREKKIRGLPWIIVREAIKIRPGAIMFENVEEIQSWGPLLDNGQPDPERKGETFNGFIAMMTSGVEAGNPALIECCEALRLSDMDIARLIKGLGYNFEGRELVAADYGAPTIRKRFYGVFRCDSHPIVWPEPTHSKNGKDGKKKWRSAAEIIDWSLPCPSIFDDKVEIKRKYGLTAVRPLAQNTMKRAIRGVDKFTIKSGKPFIIQNKFDNQPQSVDYPLTTVTSVGAHELVKPILAPFTATNTSNSVGANADEPLRTVKTGGGGGQMLISPLLTQYHDSPEFRGQTVVKPIMTIDAANRYGLLAGQLTEWYGNAREGIDINSPMQTITAKDREALIVAHMSKFYGGVVGAELTEPLPTVTGIDHNALTTAHISKFYKTGIGQECTEPLHTVTQSMGHFGLVTTEIRRYVPCTDMGYWPEVRALLNQYCGYSLADDEVILLNFGGVQYFISDIGLRMLTPRELYNAMGFPADYCIEFDVDGKPYSKSEQVARCGNAVCPGMSEALVRANFPERCIKPIRTMDELRSLIAV